MKTLCRCSSSNEVVNAAASPDREELPAVDSQGAEIVTAGVSHFDLKSALTDIGKFTAMIILHSHKFTILKSHFTPGDNYVFPKTKQNNKMRSFQAS